MRDSRNILFSIPQGLKEHKLISLALLFFVSMIFFLDVASAKAQVNINGSISGTVTDEAMQPLEGTIVYVYSNSPDFSNSNPDWQNPAVTTTDANGNYSVTDLGNGDYKVYFNPSGNYLPEYYNDKSDMASADLVTVTGEIDTPGINASLAKGGSISGTITNEAGQPLQGIGIAVYSLSSSFGWVPSIERLAITDVNGNYSVQRLPSDNYKIDFSARNYVHEYYNDKPNIDTADLVVVKAGSNAAGINAALTYDITPPVISNLSATPTCDGAVLTWNTDEPAWSHIWVEYRVLFMEPELQTSHVATLSGLISGITYNYGMGAWDAAGNYSNAYGTFTTLGGMPTLALSTTRVYWASLIDYINREVSVDYQLNNTGNQGAFGVQVTGSTATNGVTMITPMPLALGEIGRGGAANYTLKYRVPLTTAGFTTYNTHSAEDLCGNSYNMEEDALSQFIQLPLAPN